jgi:predicted RNase H-like nuclease
VAVVDGADRLEALADAADDDEVVAALPGDALALVVDAPLAVPNETGRRDAEAVLAWCDVPAFPVSLARLRRVHGGARGVELAPRLEAPGRSLAETLPDLVLRELLWEREHPPGAPALPLDEYRAAWIRVRPPAYRPKGAGRARPEGVRAAWAILSEALDLGGWAPAGRDDWAAIADAARIDALCCAYAALRAVREGGRWSVTLGTPERGIVTAPADANLRERVALHLSRLRAEGSVAI